MKKLLSILALCFCFSMGAIATESNSISDGIEHELINLEVDQVSHVMIINETSFNTDEIVMNVTINQHVDFNEISINSDHYSVENFAPKSVLNYGVIRNKKI